MIYIYRWTDRQTDRQKQTHIKINTLLRYNKLFQVIYAQDA